MGIKFREETDWSRIIEDTIDEGYIDNPQQIELLKSNIGEIDVSGVIPKGDRLYWLYEMKENFSLGDFSSLLGDIWTSVEFANRDLEMILHYIEMFRAADKSVLMSEMWDDDIDEWGEYLSLPEEVTVYRGCPNNPEGLSWTLDIEVARWFANRDELLEGVKGEVYQAIVKKENILACFGGREEKEIVVDTQAINGSWSRV